MIFQRVSSHDVELEHFLAGLLRQKESSPQEKRPRRVGDTEAVSFRHPMGAMKRKEK